MLTQGHENGGALESGAIIHLSIFKLFPQIENLAENVIHLKVFAFALLQVKDV